MISKKMKKKMKSLSFAIFLILISLLFLNLTLAINSKELALKLNRLELIDGDVNADGKVDIFDLAAIGLYYNTDENNENWNWKVDIANTVGEIDIFDLAEVGLNYGKIYAQTIEDPVFVSPSIKNVTKGKEFLININISTPADVYAVDFILSFNNEIITALNVTEGNFLKKDGVATYPVINIDNSAGRIEFANTRLGTTNPVSGEGILAQIKFRSTNLGASDLDFVELTLVDPNLNDILNVSTIDGEINVIPGESPSIVSYGVDNLYISPNGDGIKDSVTFNLKFSEKVNYKIEIINADGDTVKEWTGYGVDSGQKTWNGMVEGTAVEGIYTIKVTLKDEDGNEVIDESKTIIVDVTSPIISDISKVPEPSYNNNDVILSANVVDKNIDKVWLESDFEKAGILKNYTLTSSSKYSYLISAEYLKNQQIVSYKFHALDLAGNDVESNMLSFKVQNRKPSLSIPNQETDEDVKPSLIDLNTYSGDEDNDELTFEILSQSNPTLISCSIYSHYIDCSTPASNQHGISEIMVKVSDGIESVTDSFFMVVNSINDLPIANDDSAITNEDTSVIIDVLANDYDVEGPVSLDAITIQPAHGTAVINDDKIDYTPDQNYNGQDSFEYKIRDFSDATATATVTITVNPVNDAPVANDDSVTIDEDNSVLVNVLANDYDVEKDSLTIRIIGEPSHGLANIQNNNIHYTPNLNYFGADVVEYEVSDGQLTATATVTITVNPINDAPVIDDYFPLENPTIQEKQSQKFNIAVSDVDDTDLEIKWYLDGKEIKTGNSYEFLSDCNSQGTYEVKAVVNDGKLTDEHIWQLTVEDVCSRIYLKSGNNIFSLPRNEQKSFNELNTDCNVVVENGRADLAYYKPSGANISTINYNFVGLDETLYPGQGYFIKVENDCYVEMFGEKIETKDLGYLGTKELKEGWNLVGAPTDLTVFSRGNCILFNNVGILKYGYDVASCNEVEGYNGGYSNCTIKNGISRCRCEVDNFEPGFGYWIRTANDCVLG